MKKTRYKSRMTYWIIVVIIYIIYISAVMGDWYLWQFFLPFMTLLFFIPAILLSFPIIHCLNSIYNATVSNKKRILSFIVFLILTLTSTLFVIALFVNERVLTDSNTFLVSSQKNIDQYQSAFTLNKENLEFINEEIIGSSVDGYIIHSYRYPKQKYYKCKSIRQTKSIRTKKYR